MKRRMDITLDEDIVRWVQKYGGHRTTDPKRSQFNVSELVNGFLRRMISDGDKVWTALQLKERRGEVETEVRVLDEETRKRRETLAADLTKMDEEARTALGCGLDEYLGSIETEVMAKALEIVDSAGQREVHKQSVLDRLWQEWSPVRAVMEREAWKTNAARVDRQALQVKVKGSFKEEMKDLRMSVVALTGYLEGRFRQEVLPGLERERAEAERLARQQVYNSKVREVKRYFAWDFVNKVWHDYEAYRENRGPAKDEMTTVKWLGRYATEEPKVVEFGPQRALSKLLEDAYELKHLEKSPEKPAEVKEVTVQSGG